MKHGAKAFRKKLGLSLSFSLLSARSKDLKTPEDGKSPGVVGVPE